MALTTLEEGIQIITLEDGKQIITLEDGIQIGVGLLLYTQQQEVLLMLRDNKPEIFYPNTWCIFTGDPEVGDWRGDSDSSLERAVKREIREELRVKKAGGRKVRFSPKKLELFCRYKFSDPQNGYERHQFVFRSGLHVPIGSLALGNEGQRLELFTKDEIKGVDIAPSYKEAILSHFDKR